MNFHFKRQTGAVVASALAALLAASAVHAQEIKELNVLVPSERATSDYPVFVAEELGFYADEGLKVNFLPSDTTVPYLAFLLNSQADLVVLDPAQVTQAVNAGQEVSVIYEFMQLAPEGLAVPADSPIKTLADLKGKTIGMASDRDTVTAFIALSTVGMTTDDVKLVVIGDAGPVIVKALRDGAIDAYAGGSNELPAIVSGGIPIRNLTPPEISQNPGNNFVILNSRKDELRESVVGFLRAWNKASNAAVLDLTTTAAITQKIVPEQWEDPSLGNFIIRQSAYELLLQRTRLRGEPQPDVWERLQGPFLKMGEITEVYDPATFLDASFIEPAMEYETSEVKEALAEWRTANPEFVTTP
jgi:NitT/TauT family transport system substrate-binding protein